MRDAMVQCNGNGFIIVIVYVAAVQHQKVVKTHLRLGACSAGTQALERDGMPDHTRKPPGRVRNAHIEMSPSTKATLSHGEFYTCSLRVLINTRSYTKRTCRTVHPLKCEKPSTIEIYVQFYACSFRVLIHTRSIYVTHIYRILQCTIQI